MALGKILNLGGIENSSPRADQSANGFRIARNILPTPDGSIIPRYHWQEPSGQPSNIKSICNIHQYDSDSLILAEKQDFYGANALFELYKNNVKVPLNSFIGVAPEVPYGGMDIQQSYRFNNTVYYLNPYGGTLFKYDGVELGYAGSNTPYFSTSNYISSGTRYLKVIQHTFDFDSNEPVSEYVQFPTNSTTVSIYANSATPSGYVGMPSPNTNVTPSITYPSAGYLGNYFIGTATYNSGTIDYTISFNTARTATNASTSITLSVPVVTPNRNGTVAAGGSTTITAITVNTSDLRVGMKVFGTSVPSNTLIASIVSSTSITVTNTIPAGTINFSFSDLKENTLVYGTGIPSGTFITSVTSSNSITVSNSIPAGSRTIYFELNNTNITSDRIGSYVFIAADQNEVAAMGFTSRQRGIALKIKSVSPLTLDAYDVKIFSDQREWSTDLYTTLAPYITYGTRTYFTYWESSSPTGVFYFRGLLPSFPDNSSTYSPSINPLTTIVPFLHTVTTTGVALATNGSENNMFLISPILNDWYNTNTKKISPNMSYPFGIGEFHTLTKYQDLLVVANDQLIWFSDTSLGGWAEQFESGNNILIGDMQYGRITSICGTGDFLFVGRERKNYYVNGNIATGNYRVQEISDVQVGPWNNASCIQVKDSVVFINSLGIYSISQGGTVTELSKKCKKNFDSFNPINIDEDVVFRMTGTSSTLSTVGISAAYDEYRQLLVFMKRQEGNPCLVLNTRNGEIYEWNGLYSPGSGVYANCIQFMYGKYYVGGIDPSFSPGSYTSLAKYAVENFVTSRSYVTSNPVKLYTTWLTSGEPSLEKEILQLKMFGRISAPTTGLKVKHYKDWDKDTAITNSEYFPIYPSLSVSNQIQFSHKKRLNSDKCLCASVGIEVTDPTTDFEIESFELEFNSIQTGMKR